jgi:hypothetical protein
MRVLSKGLASLSFCPSKAERTVCLFVMQDCGLCLTRLKPPFWKPYLYFKAQLFTERLLSVTSNQQGSSVKSLSERKVTKNNLSFWQTGVTELQRIKNERANSAFYI